jgi:nitroimidazol reductase NimA-like FMN-containing flavoprotein (pyridoxamine 5'-phosphate oxidase superfamily)
MTKPAASRPHMPGYGIADPKGGKGLLPWTWAKDRLEQGRTYWIATAGPDAKPHVMPVWGVWFAGAFFFSTGNQSRKARNLALNSRCSIATEIDFHRRPKKDQIKDSVILEGVAEAVMDSRNRKRFARIYEAKYAWDMQDFEEPIYRVRPNVVFGLTAEFTQTATRWTFGA